MNTKLWQDLERGDQVLLAGTSNTLEVDHTTLASGLAFIWFTDGSHIAVNDPATPIEVAS